jgi:hypothetical protein
LRHDSKDSAGGSSGRPFLFAPLIIVAAGDSDHRPAAQDSHLRHSRFVALMEDKMPNDMRLEAAK